MTTKDLLFEIGTEELPTKAVKALSTAFCEIFSEELSKSNLSFGIVTCYATPRRIAVIVKDLQEKQSDYINERKGPSLKAAYDKEGNLSKAALGFAASCKTDANNLEKQKTDKGEYLIFKEKVSGKKAVELLESVINNSLKKLPIAKPMRWSDHEHSFARPIHWLLLILGNKTVKLNILGIETNNKTFGHRFHSSKALTIKDPSEYESTLQKHYVIASFDSRKKEIERQVTKLAQSKKLVAIMPDSLLDEVTSLVEWPVALIGEFDKKFLDVPQECLITSMVVNQKYFAVTDTSNRIQPYFIFISNIESKNANQVINGNKRVLTARLSDAEFFYTNDKKTRLDERDAALAKVTYQQKLGSILDKSRCVTDLCRYISKNLADKNICVDEKSLIRASELAKNDLTTEMVYEFTELQGIMGKYYAINDGESNLVANSIEQHYWPKHAGDKLPESLEACVLSIADKIDTIACIFTIGQKPTGDKDPFGLRRAALSILRIMIEKKLPLDLKPLFDHALDKINKTYSKVNLTSQDEENLQQECIDFCLDRLKKYYLNQDISVNLYYSVINTDTTAPYDFNQRICAVNKFLNLPEAEQLIAANKRVKNILNKQSMNSLPENINLEVLNEPAEINLNKNLVDKIQKLEPLYQEKDYDNILFDLAKLQSPIDDFFDNVMVMTEDKAKQNNRLLLLRKVQSLFNNVADISELQ